MGSLLRNAILIAVFFVILFEGTSLLFWEVYGAKRVPYHEGIDPAASLAALDEDAWLGDHYMIPDADIGWVHDPDFPLLDRQGRRLAPDLPAGRVVFAYGDSFVFGAGVGPGETFPHYLATMLGYRVQNYGVGGYGPDQAILRLEQDLRSGQRPDVVILGMPSENIARAVNILRKLYIPTVAAMLTKPAWVRENGEWRLVNPVPAWPPTAEARGELLASLEKYDRWFAQNQKRPRYRFPYSLATVRAFGFFGGAVLRWQELYQEERGVDTLTFILSRFVGLSEQYGFQAVFVVVPMPADLIAIRDGKAAFFSEFREQIARDFGEQLLVIDVLSQPIDLARFHLKPFSGHASAYGNHIVATAIYERLITYLDDN
jgi:hypothetical protein